MPILCTLQNMFSTEDLFTTYCSTRKEDSVIGSEKIVIISHCCARLSLLHDQAKSYALNYMKIQSCCYSYYTPIDDSTYENFFIFFFYARLCPIFQVSNVSGLNLDLLKMFLNLLSARITPGADEPPEFSIDDSYSVPGVGTVVSGTTMRGTIRLNDTLLLGPDPVGNFIPVVIKSIHRKRMPVKEVRGGQTASFALKKVRKTIFFKPL